jgi:hypothetical protein
MCWACSPGMLFRVTILTEWILHFDSLAVDGHFKCKLINEDFFRLSRPHKGFR